MPQDSPDIVELPGPSGETLVLYMWCNFCRGPWRIIGQFIKISSSLDKKSFSIKKKKLAKPLLLKIKYLKLALS